MDREDAKVSEISQMQKDKIVWLHFHEVPRDREQRGGSQDLGGGDVGV